MPYGISRLGIQQREFVSKSWGWEEILHNNAAMGYCMKKLNIAAGHMTSMHRHPLRDAVIWVVSGQLIISTVPATFDPQHCSLYGITPILLKEGEAVHIELGAWHRLLAVQDTIIAEASTYREDDDKEVLDLGDTANKAGIGFPHELPDDTTHRLNQHFPGSDAAS